MTPLYSAISKYFDSEITLKSSKGSFDEGLIRLGKTADTATAKDIEKVLKSNVYKQLQVNLPPVGAKTAVQKILDELGRLEKQLGGEAPAAKDPGFERQAEALVTLEVGLKRFGLYFDWAEVSKFRSQINVLKEQQAALRTAPELVRDAQAQLSALERKLQDLLVRQAQEIAELQGGVEKVKSVGGPKIKRLETLLTQISEAHNAQTLASAEVERARKLILELRKLIESSVVQVPMSASTKTPTLEATTMTGIRFSTSTSEEPIDVETDESKMLRQSDEVVVEVDEDVFEMDFPELELSVEQSERVKDIELSEDIRILDALSTEFASLLELNPIQQQQVALLREQNLERVVQTEIIRALRPQLETEFIALQQEQQKNLNQYTIDLAQYAQEGIDTNEAIMTASVASGMLGSNALAGDELKKIEDLLRSFERQREQIVQAKAEEVARVERLLGRQASLLDELRGALTTFEPLGTAQTANFSKLLTELEVATQLRQPREDLTKALGDEIGGLQIALETWEAAARAEAERLAEEQRRLETEARQAEEARLAAERAALQQLEQERMQAMERAEAQRVEAERVERERLAAIERERQHQQAEAEAAAQREAQRVEAERRAVVAREGGMLRAMRLSLAALPDLPELATDHALLEAQLGMSAKQLEAGTPITSGLENFKLGLENLGIRAREVYAQRISDLQNRANELGALEVVMTLTNAKEGLDTGNFPDLALLETELRAHREARLAAQRRELTDLEGAVKEFAGNPQSVMLQTQIAEARGRHESGMLTGLAPLWDELENLRIAEEQAVAAWRVRAETVMREVNAYRQMGGETVRQLLRLSTVLATEPGTRLAPETRLKLERSLEEAERLLVLARQEADAANAVALALQSSGQIDDLLGIFGGDMSIMKQAAAEAKIIPIKEEGEAPEVMTVSSSGDTSNLATVWIAEVSKERGVAQAALIAANGELQAGSIHEPAKIATLLLEMDRYQRELAKELERRPARICTVEQTGGTLLALFLAGENTTKHFITVKIDDVAVMSRIFANAQRDFETLKNWSQAT
jgi:hypothetical protein